MNPENTAALDDSFNLPPGLEPATESVALRAQHYDEARAQGLLLMRIDPKKIRPTTFKNRSERSLLLHDPAFIRLAQSLAARGQDTPIRVRPVSDAAPYEFEIVSGHRRHAACLALDVARGNFPVIALIDAQAGDTLDLVRKMYRENDLREDLSPYETGMMFRQWLEAGLFRTHEAIARETGQSKQNVGKYLALAALPKYLVAAFRDERRMSLRWSSDLSQLVQLQGEALKPLAEELAQRVPVPSPDAVFTELTRSRARRRAATEVIHHDEQVAFELTGTRRRVQLKVGKALKAREVRALKEELKGWLEGWLAQHRA